MVTFGITIWTEFFMAHPDWLSSLEMEKWIEDFDPEEEDIWLDLFSRIKEIIPPEFKKGSSGINVHFSSSGANIIGDTSRFDIFPVFRKVIEDLRKDMAVDIGVHVTFGKKENPLGGNFREVFKKDVESAKRIGASVMVMHPALNTSYPWDSFREYFLDEITDPEILDIMKDSGLYFAWENMSSGQFSALNEYIIFREKLAKRLEDLGYSELIDRNVFCFDLGHLLLWVCRHPDQEYALNYVEKYLPKFAEQVYVYHIHSNAGEIDDHLPPFAKVYERALGKSEFDYNVFLKNSERVLDWIRITEKNSRFNERHIHLELNVPFSFEDVRNFVKRLKDVVRP